VIPAAEQLQELLQRKRVASAGIGWRCDERFDQRFGALFAEVIF
jgi:hypothetical protein